MDLQKTSSSMSRRSPRNVLTALTSALSPEFHEGSRINPKSACKQKGKNDRCV